MTGDYWHQDFRVLIARASFPVTLQPFDSIGDIGEEASEYDLVVIAQSRRGQYQPRLVEKLLTKFVNKPVVALCGSWCEGETRSGEPIPGLIRIYWHQWLGQLDNFLFQINERSMATWQLPKIANISDQVIHQSGSSVANLDRTICVGVSTYTQEYYLTLQDALLVSGYQSHWIEGIDSNDINNTDFSVICIEGNSLTGTCRQRISELEMSFPHTPIVLVLNFPRSKEFALARQLGITEIVSKPFQLCDLKFAIQRLLSAKAA